MRRIPHLDTLSKIVRIDWMVGKFMRQVEHHKQWLKFFIQIEANKRVEKRVKFQSLKVWRVCGFINSIALLCSVCAYWNTGCWLSPSDCGILTNKLSNSLGRIKTYVCYSSWLLQSCIFDIIIPSLVLYCIVFETPCKT